MSANAWHIGTLTRRRKGGLITTYLIEDERHRIVAELPESEFSHAEQSRNADLICDSVNRIDYLRDALERIIEATYDIDRGCPDFRAIAIAALGKETKES